jgi:hypothetical protein
VDDQRRDALVLQFQEHPLPDLLPYGIGSLLGVVGVHSGADEAIEVGAGKTGTMAFDRRKRPGGAEGPDDPLGTVVFRREQIVGVHHLAQGDDPLFGTQFGDFPLVE